MSSRKSWRGKDSPRLEQDPFGDGVTGDTKTIQLCRQAEEAISTALAGAANPRLRDLSVVRVEAQRGAAALRVLVSAKGEELTEIDEALDRASGYLRGEVARAISRKRVPALSFTVVPWDEEVGDG